VTRPAVTTAVDAVAEQLRAAILRGDPPPGERLREEALAARYDVARHTLRAALRALAAEHLVIVEPHRGARVANVDGSQLQALFELRTALEVEAVRLLEQRSGLTPWPEAVHRAAAALESACRSAGEPSSDDARAAMDLAHLALHHALVASAGSDRITQAHAALAAESRLVLLQSRSALSPTRMAQVHRQLLDDLRRLGPDALRDHLAQGQAFSTDRDVGRREMSGQAPQ
jgi:DNA-binding GntR family transcriptional regulator